jgi:hypothetical protein
MFAKVHVPQLYKTSGKLIISRISYILFLGLLKIDYTKELIWISLPKHGVWNILNVRVL